MILRFSPLPLTKGEGWGGGDEPARVSVLPLPNPPLRKGREQEQTSPSLAEGTRADLTFVSGGTGHKYSNAPASGALPATRLFPSKSVTIVKTCPRSSVSVGSAEPWSMAGDVEFK